MTAFLGRTPDCRRLAADPLRSRMERSPLMDAKRFARDVEAAYGEMGAPASPVGMRESARRVVTIASREGSEQPVDERCR